VNDLPNPPAWLADPERLLEPQALGPTPRDGLLLVHVAAAAAYEAAHIPGALLVEPGELVAGTPPAPGRLPDRARLEALFGRLGYRPDMRVVAYDDEGGGWAGRLIWTLDVIGHQHWAYLDGGIHAWHAAGLPLTGGPAPAPTPSQVTLTIDPGPIAEIPDVLAAIDDPGSVIWDARSEAEYLGLRSGSRRAGHIPGAVNIDWTHLMDPARQLRLVERLPDLLKAHGIAPEKQVITHCQTHHRSGLTYLAARLLGYPRIRAYHGSWGEWGNRDDTPVETGR
jgi:thiosulfate/3-mercaptopyruvate sulfurtransferase